MDKEQLDTVGRRFDFNAWRGINRLDRDISVRKIAIPRDLLAGLESAHVREIDPGDGSRLLRASWPVPGRESALLVMDLRECASRNAAHQVLLELLANMQAPDVVRLGDDAPGDVAFARDSNTAIVFARGNIAVSIRNGGKTVVGVAEAARTVDRWIVETGR